MFSDRLMTPADAKKARPGAGQSGLNSDRRIAIGMAFSHGQHSHQFNAVIGNSVLGTIAASIASASDAVP
jgi:hypothetical protein